MAATGSRLEICAEEVLFSRCIRPGKCVKKSRYEKDACGRKDEHALVARRSRGEVCLQPDKVLM